MSKEVAKVQEVEGKLVDMNEILIQVNYYKTMSSGYNTICPS